MADDTVKWIAIIVIAGLVILAAGKNFDLLPQATTGTGPGGVISTPSTPVGPGVQCLATDTATLKLRAQSSSDLTANTFLNGTAIVYERIVDPVTGAETLNELDSVGLITNANNYANITVSCGKPGRVILLSTSGGVPAAQADYPGFKGFYQLDEKVFKVPKQHWQLKIQATSKTGAAQLVFNNNTTAYVNFPVAIPTSGLRITADTANSSHNITAGQTLSGYIYISNVDTKSNYGNADTFLMWSLDDDDWKLESLTIKRDGVVISETPSASIPNYAWYSGKPTAGLENHFFKIGAITGYETLLFYSAQAVDSIGTMDNVEMRLLAWANYRGINNKVQYDAVDDTSSHAYVLFSAAKIVIPTATSG